MTVLTGVGLGLVLISTMLMIGRLLFGDGDQDRYGESVDAFSMDLTPVPLRHQDQLVSAMQELRDSALDLIERRREIHHLNTHQWTYAHRDETSQEIAANKRYRQARSNLEVHRLSLPTEFWGPVDSFCDTIDASLSREIYSEPKDRQVYDSFLHLWHTTMRQINDIVSGRAGLEEARQLAD
jgi:hypothetical protein